MEERPRRFNPVAAALAKKRADRAADRRRARLIKEAGDKIVQYLKPFSAREVPPGTLFPITPLPDIFRGDKLPEPGRMLEVAKRPHAARRDPTDTVKGLVLHLVEQNPDMIYDEVARIVREERPGARTTGKSVASIIYKNKK
jgi:hypothetical protein